VHVPVRPVLISFCHYSRIRRIEASLQNIVHEARMCVGLHRFLRRRKMPGGSAPRFEAEGHDAAVAGSIERMRDSTRVIYGGPRRRNVAKNDFLASFQKTTDG